MCLYHLNCYYVTLGYVTRCRKTAPKGRSGVFLSCKFRFNVQVFENFQVLKIQIPNYCLFDHHYLFR